MKKGFTAIELSITIVLISIISVFFIVTINQAMRSAQLNAAADRLLSDVRYARNMAAGTARWYGVLFEVAPTNRYTVYTTTGTVDTVTDNPAKLGNSFIIDVGTDYQVNISSVNIEGGNKVEFNPIGVPYTDRTGTATSNEGVVTLSNGSASKTVRITPNTGRTFIQ